MQKRKSTNDDFLFSIEQSDSITNNVRFFVETKLSSIELVTLLPQCDSVRETIYNDDITEILGHKMVQDCYEETIIVPDKSVHDMANVRLKENRIGKRSSLEKRDVEKVLSILYKPNAFLEEYPVSSCYLPRHGICFFDESKSLIGFFEVCFECNGFRTVGEIPVNIEFSESKFENLKQLYKKYALWE